MCIRSENESIKQSSEMAKLQQEQQVFFNFTLISGDVDVS